MSQTFGYADNWVGQQIWNMAWHKNIFIT